MYRIKLARSQTAGFVVFKMVGEASIKVSPEFPTLDIAQRYMNNLMGVKYQGSTRSKRIKVR